MSIVMTDHGPFLEESSPDLLTELLHEYEAELVRLGAPMDALMAPGIDRGHLERELAAVDLAAPGELVSWFGWHNGATPRGQYVAFPLAQGVMSVELAIRDYRMHAEVMAELADLPPLIASGGAPKGWLRLTFDVAPLAGECTPGDAPIRVRQAGPGFNETVSPQSRAVSLCTVVTYWLQYARAGALRWNPDAEHWPWEFDVDVEDMVTRSSLG